MQVAGVDDPGDEGPGLFGVPLPVVAPRILGPDRTGDDRERPDRERERVGAVGSAVEHVCRRDHAGERREPNRSAGGLRDRVAIGDQEHEGGKQSPP